MKINKILLASHGTPGAMAAEKLALDLCQDKGTKLHLLLVVPDFWKGMMGDDWLNNAVTQIRFGNYLENQVVNEAAAEIDRITEVSEKNGIPFSHEIRVGKPAHCLLEAAGGSKYDLVVIGSPRPKGAEGYRSRMDLDVLTRALSIRLMIAPHPDR